MVGDVNLLIPIRVQLDTTLLHQHAAVTLLRIKCQSGKVTLHSVFFYFSVSIGVENPCLLSKGQVFRQRESQLCPALRLVKLVKDSHLRAVLSADLNLSRTLQPELRVTRMTIDLRRE